MKKKTEQNKKRKSEDKVIHNAWHQPSDYVIKDIICDAIMFLLVGAIVVWWILRLIHRF